MYGEMVQKSVLTRVRSDFAYFASEFLYDFLSFGGFNFDGVEFLWCPQLQFHCSLQSFDGAVIGSFSCFNKLVHVEDFCRHVLFSLACSFQECAEHSVLSVAV